MANRRRRDYGSAAGQLYGRLRPLIVGFALASTLAALGFLGWQAVLTSAYFRVRTVEADTNSHLGRDRLLAITGLDRPVNLLAFDAGAAEAALRAHPWVASARISKALPATINLSVTERRAEGVVVLETLYLVDTRGRPFVTSGPEEAASLPLITGATRDDYEQRPEQTMARVREALALARTYRRSPLEAARPLSDVYLAAGDRLELQLGRTRVALGQGRITEKLKRLEQIFARLARRQMDADYILLGDDLERAIVKERPVSRAVSGFNRQPGSVSKEGEGTWRRN